METDFYSAKLKTYGINTLVPEKFSREYIHNKIISELIGNEFNSETKEGFLTVIEELVSNNVQGVILGCTEIPMLLNMAEAHGVTLFSTTEIHCKEIALRAAG